MTEATTTLTRADGELVRLPAQAASRLAELLPHR